MFTINQIKEAHSKVKSSADFPQYVKNLITLGLTAYDTFVSDGHSIYYGKDNVAVQSEAKYGVLKVAGESAGTQFQNYLKLHQQRQTDYMNFCKHAAETGVEKWTVNMKEMTCTYYNGRGDKILVEKIPAVESSAIS